MQNPNAPLSHLIKTRGKYKQYDKEAILRDIEAGLTNTEIATKYNVNYYIASKLRNRNNPNKITVEHAIREIERGVKPQTIIRKYGEAMYKEALEWHQLS